MMANARIPNFPVRPGDRGYTSRIPPAAPDIPPAAQVAVATTLTAMAPAPIVAEQQQRQAAAQHNGLVLPNGNWVPPTPNGVTPVAPEVVAAFNPQPILPAKRVLISFGPEAGKVLVGVETGPNWDMDEGVVEMDLDVVLQMAPVLRQLAQIKDLTGRIREPTTTNRTRPQSAAATGAPRRALLPQGKAGRSAAERTADRQPHRAAPRPHRRGRPAARQPAHRGGGGPRGGAAG